MLTMRILIALMLLVICSVQDIKTKEVNIVIAAIFGLLGLILSICSDVNIVLSSVPGTVLLSIIPGIALLILSKFISGIGEGDGHIFLSLGLIVGIEDTVQTLYFSFLFSGVYALILRIIKKADFNYSFAFAPFILTGYVLCLLLKLYTKKVL